MFSRGNTNGTTKSITGNSRNRRVLSDVTNTKRNTNTNTAAGKTTRMHGRVEKKAFRSNKSTFQIAEDPPHPTQPPPKTSNAIKKLRPGVIQRAESASGDHTTEGKEGGHSFLMDPITSAVTYRWGDGHRLKALRKAGEKLLDLDHHDKPDLGHLEEPFRRLRFTDKELRQVVEDREQFDAFKGELRKKGAITNTMMKQNLHLYVQNQLEQRRASGSPTTIPNIPTPSSTTTSSTDNRRRAFSFGSS